MGLCRVFDRQRKDRKLRLYNGGGAVQHPDRMRLRGLTKAAVGRGAQLRVQKQAQRLVAGADVAGGEPQLVEAVGVAARVEIGCTGEGRP